MVLQSGVIKRLRANAAATALDFVQVGGNDTFYSSAQVH